MSKICPRCKKEIPIEINECPNCKRSVQNWRYSLEWLNKHPIITVLCIVLIIFSISALSSDDSSSQVTRKDDLNASVIFDEGQISVTNLESQKCINSWMKINNKFSLDGYTLDPGETYTVGSMQFADKDGNRFNPFGMKPQNFSISCQGNNELTQAFYYGEW